MKINNAALLTVVLSGLIPAMPVLAQSTNVERVADGVIFDGYINDSAASHLLSELKTGDKLFIDSPGGEWGASLRVAKEVQRQNIAVSVSGACLNECAEFVFLASKSRSANVGSNVRFGAGPFLIHRAIETRPDQFSKDEVERFDKLFREYRLVLRQAGIPERFPLCVEAVMVPDFKQVRRGGAKDDVFDRGLGVKSRFAQIAVSLPVFSAFKVGVSGPYAWPKGQPNKEQLAGDFKVPIGWLESPSQCN